MKNVFKPVMLILGLSLAAFGGDKKTMAKITRIEMTSTAIYLWVSRIEGDAIPTGTAITFNQSASTYLTLAEGATEVNNTKHMLSAALTAWTVGAPTWFSWIGSNQKIDVLMPVQP